MIRLASLLLPALLLSSSAWAQQPGGAPSEPPVPPRQSAADPASPSPRIEETLARIRQLEELRDENQQLRAQLAQLEARIVGFPPIELRGLLLGADRAARVMLEVDGRLFLLREGDSFNLPGAQGPSAQPMLVRRVSAESVELEASGSGKILYLR